MSGNPQPDAIGHTQTCLQPESGAGCVNAQSADLSTGKRLAPGFGPIPPSGHAWLCTPIKIPGGFGVAPVVGVSGVATIGRIWESQKIPLVIGGIRTGNLAMILLNRLSVRRRH